MLEGDPHHPYFSQVISAHIQEGDPGSKLTRGIWTCISLTSWHCAQNTRLQLRHHPSFSSAPFEAGTLSASQDGLTQVSCSQAQNQVCCPLQDCLIVFEQAASSHQSFPTSCDTGFVFHDRTEGTQLLSSESKYSPVTYPGPLCPLVPKWACVWGLFSPTKRNFVLPLGN